MRYERKVVLDRRVLGDVMAVVLKNRAIFTKQFPDRKVNSIYLDTIDFNALQMNMKGISNREKWRLRWYGDVSDQVPMTLERKWKQNQLGGKDLHTLGSYSTKSRLTAYRDAAQIIDYVFPVVGVSYDRQYYRSADQRVRLTVDTSIYYQKIVNEQVMFPPFEQPSIVVEFKYEEEDEQQALEVISSMPFRITKNSKFVNAMRTHWF